jgi:hypothetical protein
MRPLRVMRPRGVTASMLALAAVVALTLIAGASPALAYVRRTNGAGQPLWWQTRVMPIAGYEQGFTDLGPDQIVNAMTTAALQWTRMDPDLATCTDLALPVTVHDASEAAPPIARDNVNTIAARLSWEYDQAALAQTSLFFVKSTGEILEADVEVNAQDFVWTDVTVDPGHQLQDLQNALTHELGHFIGLDHPCYLVDPVPDETDNSGQPVPNCDDVPADSPIRDTTMFPSADPGDVTKRTLSSDDELAVCDIYPVGMKTLGSVTPMSTSGCGCTVGPGSSSRGGATLAGVAPVMAFVLAGLMRGRRRPRAAPRSHALAAHRPDHVSSDAFESSLPRRGSENQTGATAGPAAAPQARVAQRHRAPGAVDLAAPGGDRGTALLGGHRVRHRHQGAGPALPPLRGGARPAGGRDRAEGE